MRTLYVFKIKKEYRKIVKNNEFNLYEAINSINYVKKDEVNYAYDLLMSINVPLNKFQINKMIYNNLKKLDGYTLFKNRHKYLNYFSKEESELIVKNNYMLLISNKDNNLFLNEIKKISDLFICDFDSTEYFFVS